MEVQQSLIASDIYSIDTNVFLDIWCPPESNIFSKHRMPELWTHIEKLVEEGRIITTKEVYDELKNHAAPDLWEWLEAHKYMFIAHEPNIIAHATNIINDVYAKYKNGYMPHKKDAADPFVVALALTRNGTVFSQEQRQDPHIPSEVGGPKVPTVCDECSVVCVNIDKFILREGFKISMVEAATS